MNLYQLLNHIGYTVLKGQDVFIKSLTIDSRKVTPDSLFICISGFHVDGHQYIDQAADKGAVAVLVEKDVVTDKKITVIRVEDTRKAMAYIASAFYENAVNPINLVGVTGTNGKTSIVYFMETVLKAYGKTTGIIGTVDTRVGGEPIATKFATSTTPDTIELHQIFQEMRKKEAEYVVMEVTSHGLELQKVEGLNFKTAIFTNLTQDHLDLHGSMKEYRKVKSRLFAVCENAVINIDDDAGSFMISKARGKVISYSIEKDSDLRAVNIIYTDHNVSFDTVINKDLVHFEIPIPGKFTVYNALGTIGACLTLGIPVDIIASALKTLKGVPGRIQSVPNERGFNVFVDYAHTPDGLMNIISAVKEFTKGRVITVFGCGGDRDKAKRPIMGHIAGRYSDYCVITSDNPRSEDPEVIISEVEPGVQSTNTPYQKVTDRQLAIITAIKMAEVGDSVIIAGKGHENYQIFAHKTIHFDDTEIAQKALSREGEHV